METGRTPTLFRWLGLAPIEFDAKVVLTPSANGNLSLGNGRFSLGSANASVTLDPAGAVATAPSNGAANGTLNGSASGLAEAAIRAALDSAATPSDDTFAGFDTAEDTDSEGENTGLRPHGRVGSYPACAVTATKHASLLDRVEEAFTTLPTRYRGEQSGFRAAYRIELTDLGRSWTVELGDATCKVSDRRRRSDVTIKTDAETWLNLRDGELSGLDAFGQRRLAVDGNLHLAISFEAMFELPGGRPPKLQMHSVRTGKAKISTLSAGEGDEVALLIHGLGANKASMLETVSALTPHYRVHAVDLPGFGESSKPQRAPYDPAWFARSMVRLLDSLGVDRAHVIGNSLGGRIAIEMGLLAPERVSSVSLLAPSLAWRRHRELATLIKAAPPGIAAIPHLLPTPLVRRQFWGMFARPKRVDPDMAEAGCSEFVRTYGKAGARVAFLAAARNIVLEEPFGPNGFWERLGELVPPALFIWGNEDPLVPIAFSRYVNEALPSAEHAILDECGHVPQIELPEQTHELILGHMDRASGADRVADGGNVVRMTTATRRLARQA